MSILVLFGLVLFQFDLVCFCIIWCVTIVQICQHAESEACSLKVYNFWQFQTSITQSGYILIWFGMALHYLVCEHCPDMLPCKIWSLQLQKCPSYTNFSIVYLVWLYFSLVWHGFALFVPILIYYLIPSKSTELCPIQNYFVWFGMVLFGLNFPHGFHYRAIMSSLLRQ